MFEELTWLFEDEITNLFHRYSEDKLREVINWVDDQQPSIKAKVKPILESELNRRAAEYYESKNHGEWI